MMKSKAFIEGAGFCLSIGNYTKLVELGGNKMHIDKTDTQSAVHVFGEDSQKRQAIEEMGELMAAMNQYRRGRVKEVAVQEEIADVMIMMEQLAHIYGYHGVAYYVEQKMKRLNQRRAEEAWRQHDERFARYKELEKAKSIGL